MKNEGFMRLLDFTPASIQEALKGKYGRIWTTSYRLSVIKSHALFESIIVDQEYNLRVTLPEHFPFYMMILSSNGLRTVLITDNIDLTLSANEQAVAQFTLKM